METARWVGVGVGVGVGGKTVFQDLCSTGKKELSFRTILN